jgi:cytochrome oxidase Cu insertion factor (SCO1/SenC/PrrC family)
MRLRRWTWGMAVMLLGVVLLLLNSTPAMALQVGDKAPDFSLPATTAEKVSLTDFVGKKPVVVFFYIGAFTRA